ncbi:MAG: hypothetical protein JWR00_3581, partial [Rubritepida sp.]|nr:hypothetical protein [Rubritepida sp.]
MSPEHRARVDALEQAVRVEFRMTSWLKWPFPKRASSDPDPPFVLGQIAESGFAEPPMAEATPRDLEEWRAYLDRRKAELEHCKMDFEYKKLRVELRKMRVDGDNDMFRAAIDYAKQ